MILKNNTITDISDFSEKIFENGLSIYEVIRVYNEHPIFLSDNLQRLDNSIKKSNIDIHVCNLHIENKLNELIRLEQMKEGNIKYVLHFTTDKTDEYIYQIPHCYPTEKDYREGVATISCQAMRNNPEVKYINNGLRDMTNRLLREHAVYEVLLIDRDGWVTEGSRSNVFFIKDGIFYTAPTRYVLPGTARKRVLDICKEQTFPLREERVAYQNLPSFDAAFITGTSPLVLPIKTIDHYPFSPDNRYLRKLMEIYFSLLNNVF